MQGQRMTGWMHRAGVAWEDQSRSPAEPAVPAAEHVEVTDLWLLFGLGELGRGAQQHSTQQHSTQQLHPALRGQRDREGQSRGQSCDKTAPQHPHHQKPA